MAALMISRLAPDGADQLVVAGWHLIRSPSKIRIKDSVTSVRSVRAIQTFNSNRITLSVFASVISKPINGSSEAFFKAYARFPAQ